ncbi:MAG: lysylphosphatidylglycerol synthase transmembrane domain-containing protein [Bacteroidaceae bacterium]|nr:lysylphosphatidylglycerol synthase transmembrane domain-containing protein [Bacteroidaceae bacterium]
MTSNKTLKKAINIAIPFVLGGSILWWMYRNTDFQEIENTVLYKMDWGWMLFSLVFGITAQLFRGIRWRQTLEPIGEKPRWSDCIHAVFISYASSLIIPRSGEFARCAILAKYDGVSFTKALGTVVTERVIDSLLILLITAAVILSQFPVFNTFFDHTGTNLEQTLRGFTTTGYIVTAICLVITIAFIWFILSKFTFVTKIKAIVANIKEGILSLKDVKNKWLFAFYTIAIWASYFLHYWLTFKCFDFTEELGFTAAIVSFIVGSISVIVPTPNGAGPWHFAVKTILVLYGIASANAEAFALIVHTIQTALVPLLGIFSFVALSTRALATTDSSNKQ